MLAGSIDIHTHIVHHTFYRLVEASLEFRLIDVVLILPDTYALRVDLHQFSQGIHQPSANAHRTADGHVLVRKLLTPDLRCRIDGSTVLAYYENGNVFVNLKIGRFLI